MSHRLQLVTGETFETFLYVNHFYKRLIISLTTIYIRRQTLREIFSELTTSAERWAAFKQHTDAMINSVTSTNKVYISFSILNSKNLFYYIVS